MNNVLSALVGALHHVPRHPAARRQLLGIHIGFFKEALLLHIVGIGQVLGEPIHVSVL